MCAKNLLFFLSLPVILGWLSGCETLGYYAQAVNGHAQLMHVTRDIEAVRQEPSTPTETVRRLERVSAIRDFASDRLALPDNGSYRSFAQLDRQAVVWSLVATPEFSVDPIQWCYPVVGCASYRGYFNQRTAEAAGEHMQKHGRDWTVEPVAAYSTLGWFDDPLPSTVLHWSEARLAGLIFHELAHQQLYLPGDTTFNESFASAVERIGIELWLEQQGDEQALQVWQREEQRHQAFVELLLASRERLRCLYAQPLSVVELRQGKEQELDRLRSQYRRLTRDWEGGSAFEAWFQRPINNARLALVGAYELWRPAFEALWRRQDRDFVAFYQAVAEMSKLSPGQRRKRLEGLASVNADHSGRRNCP